MAVSLPCMLRLTSLLTVAMAGLKQHCVHIPVFMLALMLDGVIRLKCELVAFWQLVHMQCWLVTEAIDLAVLALAVSQRVQVSA